MVATPTTSCGNGQVEPLEACDDGNLVDGDGCSSKCQPDGAPTSADICPGQSVKLWKGSTVILAGSTATYVDDYRASCWDSQGPDRVYALEPSEDGFMMVDAMFGSGFNAVVEIRKDTCGVSTAQVACEETFSQSFQRVVEVKRDRLYYVIVDGDGPTAAGDYSIRLELP
jgi:cysteine-rich repeat protein